jgi:hypothetical protein
LYFLELVMLRIVTYNLRAGGSNKSHWKKIFKDYDPHVFFAQESYNPDQHLPPADHGELHLSAAWQPMPGVKWGTAAYVRNGAGRPLELPDFGGSVVGVEVDPAVFPVSGSRPIRFFAVHAPQRGSYQKAVTAILDMIHVNRGDGDLVIGGDFNLSVGRRVEAGGVPTSKADIAILDRLRDKFGLVSAWQSRNVGLPLPQTLRWSRNKKTPYHCDGIFIPESWASRVRSCEVASGPEWDLLSDHNPVVLEVE